MAISVVVRPEDPDQLPPRPLYHHLALTVYWLGNSLLWGALLHQGLQSRMRDWFTEDQVGYRFAILGIVGGVVGTTAQIIIGALSDRSLSPYGRRRPFFVPAAVLSLFPLLWLGSAKTFWPFGAALAVLQLFNNSAAGPFASLLPDTVNPNEHGKASGFMGVARLLGDTGGLVLTGVLLSTAPLVKQYGVKNEAHLPHAALVTFHDERMFLLCATMAGFMLLTMVYAAVVIKEKPLRQRPEMTAWQAVRGSFNVDVRGNPDFFWLSLSRAVTNVGFYMFLEVLYFFLAFSLKVENPSLATMRLMLPAIAAAVAISIPAGILSDRYGRIPLIYASQFTMALATAIFVVAPSLTWVYVATVPAGLAYGILTSVEWALACNLLPKGESARYLGVWNASAVVPQIVAFLIAGAVGSGLSALAPGLGWRVDFALTMVCCLVGAYFLKHVHERRKASADTDRAAILVRLMSPGEAWFDDVTFTMTKAPLPVSSITERVPVEAGRAGTIPLELRFRDPLGTPPPQPTIAVTRRDGTIVPGATAQFKATAPNVLTGTIALPALQNADHTLKLTFPQGEVSFGVFPYVRDRKPGRLTDTGSLLVGGKPFFPIGVYHVSVSEYALLAECGFTAVQGLVSADLATYENQFKQAQAAGIMVDVPLYLLGKVGANLPLSLQKIALTKEHPALLNWKIIDEPDLRPDVIDEVADAYRQLKQADPQTPILLTIASPPSFPYWINYCDMLQVDPYPIPRAPLTLVSDTVKAAVAVKQPWQHVTAVLQCGWISNADGTAANQPTYDQALSMVYLSLINGAKGIGWYSMHDPGWDLSQTPLWQRFAELNRATARLGEIVLSDQSLATSVAGDMVQAKAWQHEGKTYLLVTNPDKQRRAATIKLDKPVTGCEGATGTVDARVEGGAVPVSLPPYASHTLVLR